MENGKWKILDGLFLIVRIKRKGGRERGDKEIVRVFVADPCPLRRQTTTTIKNKEEYLFQLHTTMYPACWSHHARESKLGLAENASPISLALIAQPPTNNFLLEK